MAENINLLITKQGGRVRIENLDEDIHDEGRTLWSGETEIFFNSSLAITASREPFAFTQEDLAALLLDLLGRTIVVRSMTFEGFGASISQIVGIVSDIVEPEAA